MKPVQQSDDETIYEIAVWYVAHTARPRILKYFYRRGVEPPSPETVTKWSKTELSCFFRADRGDAYIPSRSRPRSGMVSPASGCVRETVWQLMHAARQVADRALVWKEVFPCPLLVRPNWKPNSAWR